MHPYSAPEIRQPSMDKFRYSVLLAPFQPATRIELEAKINTNVECYLDVKNTSDKTLNISVTKLPSVKRRIDLSLSELEIQGHSNGTLCIKWSPREAGRWRDVLQLTDSRRIKYDIVIATIAKDDKKSNKTKRPKSSILSNMSSLSTLTISKQSHRNNILEVPSISQSLSSSLTNNLDTQIKQYKLENNLDKENILNKNNGTKSYASQTKDYYKRVDEMHYNRHDKSENILCEQNINVWSDSSILPQVLLPLNAQDIRRATYIKERKPCNSILNEHHKEVHENMKCNKNKTQSDFSILLNKFTFTSTDVISSSPTRRESTESITSHIIDKHKTFNISHQFFDTSMIYDAKTIANTVPVLQPTSLYNLSPIKSDKCSLMTGIKDLISSSPIQFQHYIPTDSNEYINHFMVDKNPNIQTTNCEYFSFEVISRNDTAAKKTGDVYIEISPPKKHFCSKMVPKVNSARIGRIMKNNTLCDGRNRKKLQVNIAAKNDVKNIPAIKINKFSLSTLRNTKWYTGSGTSSSRDSSFRIRNEEEYFIYETCGLDPFAPSTIEDPFLKNTVYFNEPWLLQQELAFTKWLNALLSSPEDLSVDIETAIVDIGKVWQTYKAQKDTVLAETKEAVSARYHTNTRLNTLRKAANVMFKRDEVTQVLSRTNMYITKGTLCIRSDRNLHRDIGLQKLILSLFLSYNPLWLRIGLETVYKENISLRSNNDIVGLTRFLLTRFFSNPRLTKMPGYHKTDSSQKFVTLLNQFSLRKFLFLIYFLDYAKQHKLIGHDPCLFHKRAQYKESREILLSFSRELLSGIGDVTRMLRGHNYVLTYRQTYIEEYDYAVVNIRHDLRDGVRLCRVMELITGTQGLTQRCRVPAISRLQKIHNVDMALNALCQVGYILEGNIDAKSIVDGHCEKTLSLLWQIIHKYQAPRFDRAIRVIQKWWRAQLWYIYVRNFLRARKNLAATVIQRMWRCKQTQSLHVIETDGNLEERKRYLCIRAATIQIQKWWKQVRKSTKMQELRKRHKAVIVLQRRWKATLLMQMQQSLYHNLKNAALTIQIHWRATRVMKLQRSKYLMLRDATKIVQSWWRSVKAMQKHREWFLCSKESSCIIQTWWRQHLLVRKARNDFLHKRAAVRNIERWWLSILNRKKFFLYRKNIILIQRTWNKYQMRKREVACLKIQTWWRAAMYSHRYKLQKYSCLKLQRWWRRLVLMRHQHLEFLQLQKVAYIIQKNWRAKTIRRDYLKQQQAALLIQSWYRRANSARAIRRHYLKMRGAATRIQNWWRNITEAHQERRRYLQLCKSAVFLQIWYRRVLARVDQQRYLTKRKACVIIQSWWRMIKTRSEYKRFMVHVLEMQRRWRAKKAARIMRREYLLTRAVIVVQARWRVLTARKRFVALRQATIVIQSCYRMKVAIRRYEASKYAAMVIQAYWRAYIVGREERLRYLSLRQATIMLQRRYKRKKTEREMQCHVNDIALLATKIQDECGGTIQVITTKLTSNDYWQKKINVLRSCNSVGMLLTCLYSLDTITILSPTICIILCELNLADDIYNTIVQNNRSLPWMKICLRACSILITLSKYSYTRKYVLKAITMCPQINYLMKNIQQKVLKDVVVVKFQKFKDPEKLYPNCEPDRNNLAMQKPRLFTDMSIAVTAIVKRICT
ncbi:PREDICTED: protein abnormal spindle [Atta cephalotes]|uniref:Calponin-homology (CH) domain-containing protein n=1 Tax=Atta cephalotes TaxID=12957 RepID=A0A158NQH2_ATTCE|nr:PREDICTED: protein abnormal spindle [Atta cephalotes]